ncbi:FAD-dependent oxidoreductase [Paenarthrobacter sp. NPDC089675]|uniref:NAD(P)/FAD-dependent oxidoreductase n=1 Tax=Paenarthrobacter sp. NPDC089675 TaxID=3364376 RepID=UPI003811EDA1
MTEPVDFDVIVIGAGPAGLTAAMRLNDAGYRCAVFERDALVSAKLPETIPGLDCIVNRNFPGVNLQAAKWKSTRVEFMDHNFVTRTRLDLSSFGDDGASTVRVSRSELDAALRAEAIRRGLDVRCMSPVLEVSGLDGGDSPVTVQIGGSTGQTYTARVVVDASGKMSFLSRARDWIKLGKTLDDRVGVFSHFTWSESNELTESATMRLVEVPDGYVFVIPVAQGRVSVGAVVSCGSKAALRSSPEETFADVVHEIPRLESALSQAERKLPYLRPINAEYTSEVPLGPRHVVIGDAVAFADPFFDRGFEFAVVSGEIASGVVADLLTDGVHDSSYAATLMIALDEIRQRAATARPYLPARAFVDPHLPWFVPLAAAVTRTGSIRPSNSGDDGQLFDMVQSARDNFSA